MRRKPSKPMRRTWRGGWLPHSPRRLPALIPVGTSLERAVLSSFPLACSRIDSVSEAGGQGLPSRWLDESPHLWCWCFSPRLHQSFLYYYYYSNEKINRALQEQWAAAADAREASDHLLRDSQSRGAGDGICNRWFSCRRLWEPLPPTLHWWIILFLLLSSSFLSSEKEQNRNHTTDSRRFQHNRLLFFYFCIERCFWKQAQLNKIFNLKTIKQTKII